MILIEITVKGHVTWDPLLFSFKGKVCLFYPPPCLILTHWSKYLLWDSTEKGGLCAVGKAWGLVEFQW